MMQTDILGWDIGGAHVKAALLNSNGEAARFYRRCLGNVQGML
jgi:uncharacterized hydantoinase/oxoprolinase family protein